MLRSPKEQIVSPKYLLPIFASMLGWSSGAIAADLGGRYDRSLKDAPLYYERPLVWHGFYYGAHFGGAFDQSDKGKIKDDLIGGGSDIYNHPENVFEREDFSFRDDQNDDEFIAGAHLGYNWQHRGGPLVLGIEADVSFAGDIDYLTSLRGRVGYATHRFMAYVTGGVAFTEFDEPSFSADFNGDESHTFSNAENDFIGNGGHVSNGDNGNDVEVGWVIGGGIEYLLHDMMSLGVEGLYYSFDDVNSQAHLVHWDGFDVNKFSREEDRDLAVVRARLNIHLHKY